MNSKQPCAWLPFEVVMQYMHSLFAIVLFPAELPHRTMARRILHTFIFLTLLAVESYSNIAPQVIYQKLEEALIADSNVLYKIQETFIPSRILPRNFVKLHVCVTVGSVLPVNCDNSSLFGGQSNFSYCQDFQWTSSALLDLISIDQLLILDNAITFWVFHIRDHLGHIDVPLHIDTLPCDTTEDDILAALMQLLPWVCICSCVLNIPLLLSCNLCLYSLSLQLVTFLLLSSHLPVQVKSYARVNKQRNENDKGYVSINYFHHVTNSYYKLDTLTKHAFRFILLFTFIFLNILIPVALAKSVSLYYPRIMVKSSTGDFIGCLYWATAIVAFLYNIVYAAYSTQRKFLDKPAITSCVIHPKCSIPSDTSVYKDEVLTMLAVYIIIPSTVFIELLVSILAVKYDFRDQRSPRQVGQCPSCKQWFLQSIHVLALWNILIAIQLITMIVIPIFVLLFLNPQVTVLFVILLLMLLVSLTLNVAYLLYHCQQPRRRRVCGSAKYFGQKFIQLVVMIAILGLITTLLALYEVILLVQAQAGTGVKGLLLSLLPSFPLSAIGWYLKRRSQRKAENYGERGTPGLMVDEQPSMHMFENSRPLPV